MRVRGQCSLHTRFTVGPQEHCILVVSPREEEVWPPGKGISVLQVAGNERWGLRRPPLCSELTKSRHARLLLSAALLCFACLLFPNRFTDPSVPDPGLSMWHLEMTSWDTCLVQWGLRRTDHHHIGMWYCAGSGGGAGTAWMGRGMGGEHFSIRHSAPSTVPGPQSSEGSVEVFKA